MAVKPEPDLAHLWHTAQGSQTIKTMEGIILNPQFSSCLSFCFLSHFFLQYR